MEAELKIWLQERVNPHRFGHCLRVLDAADAMGRHLRLDTTALRIAGLLHDCARELSDPELVAQAEAWGLPVRPVDRREPVLLHGRVGAEMVRRQLGISDTVILGAITAHTSGHPRMSLADKVVFLADLIEPGRRYPHRTELEQLAFANIDRAMLLAIGRNCAHVERIGALVDPDTLELQRLLEQELT